MIAGKMLDPVVGVDIHIIQPPGPVPPVPIPHPFIGMVVDPMDLAPIIGATVMINGMPRATAGTGCKNLPPHIPIGGTFIKPPGNEGEIFMGSATVLADGSPLSFLALPVLSCSDIGMPPPPRPKKKGGAKSLALPTTVLMAIPAGMPVMVGGPPTIDMMAMAMKAGMAGLGKAFKKLKATKAMKKASDKIHDAAEAAMKKMKVPKNARNKVHKGICSVTGHPVDIASGKVFTDQVDFEIPGPIPLKWERTWFSTSIYDGPLGHGWHHSYDMGMVIDEAAGYVAVKLNDGRNVSFPTLEVGDDAFDRQEKLSLFKDEEGYYLRDRDRLYYRFGLARNGIKPLASISNGPGFKIEFSYTLQGHLKQITDSANRVFTMDTDGSGRITAIHAPHPDKEGETFPIMRYAYDSFGDMVKATDALDHSFTFEYNNHLLVQETNRNGLSFYFEYDGVDSSAKCVHTWGDGGIYDHKLTYAGGMTIVENSLGYKTTHFHDGAVVYKRIDAMGGEYLTRFNDFYEIVEEVDPLYRTTQYEYDARGNRVSFIYPDGSSLKLSYEDDRLVAAIDQLEGQWIWNYDENHLLNSRVDCLGRSQSFAYSDGLLSRIVDFDGETINLEYDNTFNLSLLSSRGNIKNSWKYDSLGRTKTIFDSLNNSQEKEYNLVGRVVKIKEPDGNKRVMDYDPEGNLIWIKDLHFELKYDYQGMNLVRSKTEGGNKISYEYDLEENLIGIINEKGAKYRLELDANGNLEVESGFDGIRRYYKRDKAGQISSILNAIGIETQYTYDEFGRVTETRHSNGEWEKYEFRPDGELISTQNSHTKVSFSKDLMGNVTEEKQGEFSVYSKYDLLGSRVELQSSLGARFKFSRDILGDLTKISIKSLFESPTFSSPGEIEDITHEVFMKRDKLGFEVERNYPGNITTKWKRDNLGRPLKQEIETSGIQQYTKSYIWEANNRLRQIIEKDSRSVSYFHDKAGNLVSLKSADGIMERRVGNFHNNSSNDPITDPVMGIGGQIMEQGGKKYEYDAIGNLIKKVEPNGEEWNYEWTAFGFLKSVTRPAGEVVSFIYDSLGRRISKNFNGKTTNWVWDGDNLLHEWTEIQEKAQIKLSKKGKIKISKRELQSKATLDPGSNLKFKEKSSLITWVFGDDGLEPIAKVAGQRIYNILSDHMGTPQRMYDEKGEEVWIGRMDINGKLRAIKGKSTDCPFRYPGQYEDDETGLYYNRFRYFDPDNGQYISQDPIRLASDVLEFYAYVPDFNLWIDPLGLAFGSGKGQHTATVRVFDTDGTMVHESVRKSGDMTPEEKALGFPKSSLATHTEARAVKHTPLTAGQRMEIIGQYPPCNSCKGKMRKASAGGKIIEYKWTEDGVDRRMYYEDGKKVKSKCY